MSLHSRDEMKPENIVDYGGEDSMREENEMTFSSPGGFGQIPTCIMQGAGQYSILCH